MIRLTDLAPLCNVSREGLATTAGCPDASSTSAPLLYADCAWSPKPACCQPKREAMLPQKPTELSDAWLDSIFAVATYFYLPSAIAVRRRRQTSTPTLTPNSATCTVGAPSWKKVVKRAGWACSSGWRQVKLAPEREEIAIMQAPGAEWLVILNDRQLWEGQIRQRHHAARSRRPEQRIHRQYVSLTFLGRLVPNVSRWTRIAAAARSLAS